MRLAEPQKVVEQIHFVGTLGAHMRLVSYSERHRPFWLVQRKRSDKRE